MSFAEHSLTRAMRHYERPSLTWFILKEVITNWCLCVIRFFKFIYALLHITLLTLQFLIAEAITNQITAKAKRHLFNLAIGYDN